MEADGFFDPSRCTQCGDCCEQLYLPITPLRMLAWTAWAFHDCAADGWDADQGDEHRMYRLMGEWFLEIEPDGEDRYRCPRFVRTSPDFGYCARYADRPDTCSRFPYGATSNYPRCAFNPAAPEARLSCANA